MTSDNDITVMQVFAALDVHPSPSVSWSVGTQVANMYALEYGAQPPKDNRPKTYGGGSHCFALYPPFWRERIERVIRATVEAAKSQGDLFDPDNPF